MAIKKELRVVFEQSTIKDQLEELAKILEMSMNQLVNKILSAQFNNKDYVYLQLLYDLAEIKKEAVESNG